MVKDSLKLTEEEGSRFRHPVAKNKKIKKIENNLRFNVQRRRKYNCEKLDSISFHFYTKYTEKYS